MQRRKDAGKKTENEIARVVVECKATTEENSIFQAQALTYLRLMNLHLGLVINFGRRLIKDGVHRVVNNL